MRIAFFIVLLTLFSCIKKDNSVPDDVLNRKEMAHVMTEMHILESRIYKLYLKEDSARVLFNHYEQLLLDSLDVPKEKYERSLGYYVNEVKQFEKVYDVVVDTLLSRQKTEKD